jgi:hypothetical protein
LNELTVWLAGYLAVSTNTCSRARGLSSAEGWKPKIAR